MAYSVPFSARSGNSRHHVGLFTIAAAAALSVGLASPALSQTLGYAGQSQGTFWSNDRSLPSPQVMQEDDSGSILPERFRRRVVSFDTREAPGTIVIDTGNTALYYVLGGGRAIRYGVGVGREGFTWSGVQNVSRKAAWPDWHPPAEMIARQPYLPRFVAGGPEIRWELLRCILAPVPIGSTARTIPRPLESLYPAAVFV